LERADGWDKYLGLASYGDGTAEISGTIVSTNP
jgi:hypothetical protein